MASSPSSKNWLREAEVASNDGHHGRETSRSLLLVASELNKYIFYTY